MPAVKSGGGGGAIGIKPFSAAKGGGSRLWPPCQGLNKEECSRPTSASKKGIKTKGGHIAKVQKGVKYISGRGKHRGQENT